MKIIQPSFIIEDPTNLHEANIILSRIEKAGRTCYKSENNITTESSHAFIKNILSRGHDSVIEHEKITVRIICDRGVSHEIVRHRLASYSQESTRYCNYSKDKFGNELTFIDPSNAFDWKKDGSRECSRLWCIWEDSMKQAEVNYLELIAYGATPQEARTALPNSIKTEIVMTMNLREWRWFFTKRTPNEAHPQMRQITRPMLIEFRKLVPIIFDDVGVTNES